MAAMRHEMSSLEGVLARKAPAAVDASPDAAAAPAVDAPAAVDAEAAPATAEEAADETTAPAPADDDLGEAADFAPLTATEPADVETVPADADERTMLGSPKIVHKLTDKYAAYIKLVDSSRSTEAQYDKALIKQQTAKLKLHNAKAKVKNAAERYQETSSFNLQREAAFKSLQDQHKQQIAARQEELALESTAPAPEALQAHKDAAAAAFQATMQQAAAKVRELDALRLQRTMAQAALKSKTAKRNQAEATQAALRAADKHRAAAQQARDARVEMAHKADAVIQAALGEALKEQGERQATKGVADAAKKEEERMDQEAMAAEMKAAEDAIALAMAKDNANNDQLEARGEKQMVHSVENP